MSHGSTLDAALCAVRRGWSVVPMHVFRGGRCSCGAASCPSPGKHPRLRWDAYQHRLPTEDDVRRWWHRWRDPNLAVVTGAVSGLVVVDVDPRSGGDDALASLEERFGALPATVECLTGGGGAHLYFRHPGGTVRSGPLVAGIDVKADGGLVIAPPSIHPSGALYTWEVDASPDEHRLADLPAWLAGSPAPGARPDDASHAGPSRAVAPRTSHERDEFAQLWARVGVRLEPGDRYYLCPFHDDHQPSLHIDADGCRWYCFGCQRGGGPGRLRRVVDRRRRAARTTEDKGERTARTWERPAPELVPATWMQWPTLQPGGTQTVVGEASYANALEQLARGRTWSGPRARWFTARLSREHANPHDPDAVRVDIGRETVGYLPRPDAARFHPMLEALQRRRAMASARAHLTGGWERGPYGRGSIGVTLDLDPRLILRQADAPFLPAELTVPTHSDEQQIAVIVGLLGDASSIDTTVDLVPGERSETLRVAIAGQEIGTLDRTVASAQLPIVRHVLTAGFPASCAATIDRRRQGPSLRLHLPNPKAI
jgi:hypothetical protein